RAGALAGRRPAVAPAACPRVRANRSTEYRNDPRGTGRAWRPVRSAAAGLAARSRPTPPRRGNAGADARRRAPPALPAPGQRRIRALARRVRPPDPVDLLRPAVAAVERPAGRAVRPGRAQVLSVRAGAVAAGRGVPGRAAGDQRAGAVPVHGRRRTAV